MSVVEARGVRFAYRSGPPAVDAVDIEVAPGVLTALVGPNGAGKTTLLGLLGGLLRPSEGEIRLDGRPMRTIPARRRAERVALVPQFASAAFDMPVEEVVALGRLSRQRLADRLRLRPLPEADRTVVEEALEETDLLPLRGRPFSTLSGGERARVRLAVAFAQGPDLLLLDEPGAHLDPGHAQDMMERLARQRDMGRGILIALHDLTLSGIFADRLALMVGGRLVAVGSPREVLTPERVREAFGPRLQVVDHPLTGRPMVVPVPAPEKGRG